MADTLISRVQLEAPVQHRALLVHFMLDPSPGALANDPEGRDWSHTALVVGVDPSVLRGWASQHRWAQRAATARNAIQMTAWEAYRHRYFTEHAEQDVPVLAPLIKGLDLVASPLKAPASKDAVAVVGAVTKALDAEGAHAQSVESLVRIKAALADEGALASRNAKVAERAKNKVEAYTEARRATLETMQRVSDTALRQLEGALNDGKIKFSVSDLKALNDLQRDLLSEFYQLEERNNAVATGVIVESVRVRQAKAAGLPWLSAVREDLAELLVIAEQLGVMEGEPSDIDDAIEVGP